VALLLVVIGLGSWNISQYAITPGDATPVAPLVKIRGIATDPVPDRIMLTDVYLQSLTALQWLTLHLQSHVEFVSMNQLLDPGVPADELDAQGYLQMSDSKQAAEVSAFRSLGWPVPATNTGAIITAVIVPSPARNAGIHVADEVVSVNARPVHTTCDLIDSVHALAPGTLVKLGVAKARISSSGVISWKSPSVIALRTAAAPSGLSASGCAGVAGPSRSWFGVSIENGVTYQLPASVTIDTSNIGGPSAGLAMTLTLIDQLSRGSLTGHQSIAATGTIDPSGQVGDVGGVAEKTVAVQRAGAKYFFVPQIEVATAEQSAQPGLKILGVSTLAQALRDLRAIGGDAPIPLTTPR
jgi:PDZ domain-containing protein